MTLTINHLIIEKLEGIEDKNLKAFLQAILIEERRRIIKPKSTHYKDDYKRIVDKYITGFEDEQ